MRKVLVVDDDAHIHDSAVATIIRSAGLLVYVASPIAFDGNVIGAVLLWRTPATILQALQHKRDLLLQAALLLRVVVVATAIVTSRLVVLPVQRLAAGAGRIARGEATELDAGPYRTVEIAQLAKSLEAIFDHERTAKRIAVATAIPPSVMPVSR